MNSTYLPRMTVIDTIKTMDQENKACIAFCQTHYKYYLI